MAFLRSVKGNAKTVFCSILENATNGDAIIRRKLDECVTDSSSAVAGVVKADENDPNYSLIGDFNVLKDGGDGGGDNDSRVAIQ